MTATTKNQIITKYAKTYGRCNAPVYVYQFPRGHWGYATPASPIGQSLVESGHIYPEIDVKATEFELVTI